MRTSRSRGQLGASLTSAAATLRAPCASSGRPAATAGASRACAAAARAATRCYARANAPIERCLRAKQRKRARWRPLRPTDRKRTHAYT
eukprot:6176045-Pleurochrysis_carterae.AAC.4